MFCPLWCFDKIITHIFNSPARPGLFVRGQSFCGWKLRELKVKLITIKVMEVEKSGEVWTL